MYVCVCACVCVCLHVCKSGTEGGRRNRERDKQNGLRETDRQIDRQTDRQTNSFVSRVLLETVRLNQTGGSALSSSKKTCLFCSGSKLQELRTILC